MPCSLEDPIRTLKGVGPKIAENLSKLNLHSIEDLLFHLPHRYLDRTRVISICDLQEDRYAVIEGVIQKSSLLFKPKRSLILQVKDSTGSFQVRFFNFNPHQMKELSAGVRIRCFGIAKKNRSVFQMIHPEYRILKEDQTAPIEEHLTPIYPTSEGLSQTLLRKLMHQALDRLHDQAEALEALPFDWLDQHHLPTAKEALFSIHQPPPDILPMNLIEGQHPAQHRLAIEELLAHHLLLRRSRCHIQTQSSVAIHRDAGLNAFLATLPFQLTGAQEKAMNEVLFDLSKSEPMHRLIQGDVGSGKTIVAAIAALSVAKQGYQVAFMVPTEILAVQHHQNLSHWLKDQEVEVLLLTGKMKNHGKKQQQEKIATGKKQIVIGTHALFQADLQFNALALVIIDEQHRFGVKQRANLRQKGMSSGCTPHCLILTATPIPRTLAMALYADLDCTLIRELPKGRQPITTVAIAASRRLQVIERVLQQCQSGRQVYWVCTLIEESEQVEAQAAEVLFSNLQQVMPNVRLGLIHGKMRAEEKETIMQQFKNHALDVLVATTVIEVGVDCPNASLMIIENPERLGLSQLHQLRGRVGRGTVASHCVLLYQEPLSESAKARLSILRESQDGFWIAEQDLALRGPGEWFGTEQAGLMRFRIAGWDQILQFLPKIESLAQELLQRAPERVEKLIRRWIGSSSEAPLF